jgi:hypothetical protein
MDELECSIGRHARCFLSGPASSSISRSRHIALLVRVHSRSLTAKGFCSRPISSTTSPSTPPSPLAPPRYSPSGIKYVIQTQIRYRPTRPFDESLGRRGRFPSFVPELCRKSLLPRLCCRCLSWRISESATLRALDSSSRRKISSGRLPPS